MDDLFADELIKIGEISSVFGVKGWVKIYSLTDPRENILDYSFWTIKKGSEEKKLRIMSGKRQGKSIIACIDGVTDRTSAETFIGWEIFINKSQLPVAADGDYYWADLVGLEVETDQGVALGLVDYLIETGANDVLVVKKDNDERLIPFLKDQVIKKIDLDANKMVVDWDPDF